jgi:ArsR family transcriptional regulator, lead/cadmium/zinc/bismuth-responsive transcriptional repressor
MVSKSVDPLTGDRGFESASLQRGVCCEPPRPRALSDQASRGHCPPVPLPSRAQVEAAAEMFSALGDPERLRLLLWLAESEACVSELAEDEGEKITTVSARLKTLSVVRLVRRRREAKHVFYALADEHVLPLIRNAIDHAAESRTAVSADLGHGKDTIP